MKIITLNAYLSFWSPKRQERIVHLVRALAQEKPDIILLQEVSFADDANVIIASLRTHGFIDSYYTKTLLVVSKQPLQTRAHSDFKNHFSPNPMLYVNTTLNWLYGKGFQVVTASFQSQPLSIVNTHLLSAYDLNYDPYRLARLGQFFEIETYLNKLGAKRIILGGDLNFDAQSSSYRTALKQSGFKDPLRELKGNTISTDNTNRQPWYMARMNQRIDHFFTRGLDEYHMQGRIILREPFTANGKQRHVSDHYGLVLSIIK